jgi:hypothetical protein
MSLRLRPIAFSSVSTVVLALASLGTLFFAGCEEGGGEDGEGTLQPSGTCSTERAPVIEEGKTMAPGGACISCHSQGEGPSFDIAGTVMAASHDGDVCKGVDGITVVITDADGNVIEIPTNSVGNFDYTGPLATPYHAKIVGPNGESAMVAAQTSGDCNSCHTEEGASNAPGRIVAP